MMITYRIQLKVYCKCIDVLLLAKVMFDGLLLAKVRLHDVV